MRSRSPRPRSRYSRPGSATCSTNCFQPATEPFGLEIAMTMPVRAALYLRVSTGRQAENDLSIPDQRRQAKAYCASRGWGIVESSEQRGPRTKKTLEIDPVQAETVRLIFRLAREGSGSSGAMGVKSIATHLNASGIRTRDGGRWGVDAVHKVLTRTSYIGRHRFNTKFWKTRER